MAAAAAWLALAPRARRALVAGCTWPGESFRKVRKSSITWLAQKSAQ